MPRLLALIHGFTGAPTSWGPVLQALGTRCPVVAPSLLGHAGCPQQEALRGGFEDEVDRLADLLRAAAPSARGRHAPPSLAPGERSPGAGAPDARAAEARTAPPLDGRPRSAGAAPPEGDGASAGRDDKQRPINAEPGPLHLCGYSLGGRLALGLLVRHPGLFAGATLLGAHHGLATETERQERRDSDERWCALLEAEGIERFADAWEAQPLFASQANAAAEALDEQRRTRRSHQPRGLVASLRSVGLGQMPGYLPLLPRIEVPVTLVTGALDPKFSALARAMLRAAPRWRHVEVAGAGHNLQLERPDLVAALLREALA